MDPILNTVSEYGVLPVINVSDPEWASPLCSALCAGGLPLIEVTLRSENSFESLKRIALDGRILAGAGTVLTLDQLRQALDCGAKFIVSPGYSQKLVDECIRLGVPVVPGCTDASTIQTALESGLTVLKYFPAEQFGGTAAMKAFHGPFPNVKFVPTGGISFDNLEKYLAQPFITACGGSFMASADQLKNGDFESIRQNCIRAVRISLGLRLERIVLRHASAGESEIAARRLAALFPMESLPLAGTPSNEAESDADPYLGQYGRIEFSTVSLRRALGYYRHLGVPVIPGESSGAQSVTLSETFGGFTLRITQRNP